MVSMSRAGLKSPGDASTSSLSCTSLFLTHTPIAFSLQQPFHIYLVLTVKFFEGNWVIVRNELDQTWRLHHKHTGKPYSSQAQGM